MVGILLSYWEGLFFRGELLVSGRVSGRFWSPPNWHVSKCEDAWPLGVPFQQMPGLRDLLRGDSWVPEILKIAQIPILDRLTTVKISKHQKKNSFFLYRSFFFSYPKKDLFLPNQPRLAPTPQGMVRVHLPPWWRVDVGRPGSGASVLKVGI